MPIYDVRKEGAQRWANTTGPCRSLLGGLDVNHSTDPRAMTWAQFWAKVSRPTPGDCWVQMTSISIYGYGGCGKGLTGDGRSSRAVYSRFIGPIPDGMQVDHKCHRDDGSCIGGVTCIHRRCVNPLHLQLLTGAANTRRSMAARRARERHAAVTHCKYGHEYTPENTARSSYHGRRQCRECERIRCRRDYARNKEVYGRGRINPSRSIPLGGK